MKKHIDWVLYETKPKTDVFLVFSISSLEDLGMIKWYAPWRQYCFFPADDCVFSKSCLEDVNNFIQQLVDERKIAKKERVRWGEHIS